MAITYYPAALYPADESGYWAVTIPNANVNAQGKTANEALESAATSLQEIVDMLRKEGAEIPQPALAEEMDIHAGGSIAVIPVALPSRAVRVNVNLPDDLLARIDAVSSNRSAFLADAALEKLSQK